MACDTARPGTARARPRCGRRASRSLDRPPGSRTLGQGSPERLEDRLEHVTAVGAVEEAHVQDEPRRPPPAPRGIAARRRFRARRCGLRRSTLVTKSGSSLVSRTTDASASPTSSRGAVSAARLPPATGRRARGRSPPPRPRPLPACLPARSRGRGRTARSPPAERAVVEHGQPRVHRRLAAPVDVDANACRSLRSAQLGGSRSRRARAADDARRYASTRSICAPTARRRSSIRS